MRRPTHVQFVHKASSNFLKGQDCIRNEHGWTHLESVFYKIVQKNRNQKRTRQPNPHAVLDAYNKIVRHASAQKLSFAVRAKTKLQVLKKMSHVMKHDSVMTPFFSSCSRGKTDD